MVIASQYLRGKGVRIPALPPPYYFDYLDAYIWDVCGAEIWSNLVDALATITQDNATFQIHPAAYRISSLAANNLRAYLKLKTFLRTPTYPFRARVRFRLDSSSVNFYEHPQYLGLWNSGAAEYTCRAGRTEKAGRDLCCIYKDGIVRGIMTPDLDTWYLLEIIEVNATDYYVEIDGAKYGPFKKRSSTMSDQIGYIGDLSLTANHCQALIHIDEIVVYRRETTYDTTGAIAPTEYTIPRPYSFEDGTLEGFTASLAGAGTAAVSTLRAYEGSYSLRVNTPAAADYAWVTSPVLLTTMDYPFKNRLYRYLESYTDPRVLVAMYIYIGDTLLGGMSFSDNDNIIDVYDSTGWTYDLYTIPTGQWVEYIIEEISATQFKCYVDGTLLGTFTKAASGKSNNVRFGDGSTTQGAGLQYYDMFERVKAI